MDLVSLLTRLAFTAAFYFVPDIVLHGAIKSLAKKHPRITLRRFYSVDIALFIISGSGFLSMQFMGPAFARFNLYFFGLFIALLMAKWFSAILLLIFEDSWRIPLSIFTRAKRKATGDTKMLISRRTFIARSALIAGLLPLAGFTYGMIRGRYRFTVHREEIFFNDLPDAFEGVTITQISDLHIGSWDTAAAGQIAELVSLINGLGSDILVFTGDIVNSRADEMNAWYSALRPLTARLGKFSVLGNHDYGDYVRWDSEEEKAVNLSLVKNIHPALGFRLLLNEHTYIQKDGQELVIAGVENWGKGDFPKFGDLDKALQGTPENSFVVLLSHDPSHWREKVLPHTVKPHLTLSGHTHGFQMGIETPAFRFSPSQWVYDEWAGLYQDNSRFLYVNRGLGTVGYPGRLGIWPEITQITLRKKKS